jgi:hypothetical protein
MSKPVNESFYDKPVKQANGSILVIVRDADGNQIGYNITSPATSDE